MPKKSKADNRTQRQKFADLAREVECDENEGAFEEKLKRIAKPSDADAKQKSKHTSKKNGV